MPKLKEAQPKPIKDIIAKKKVTVVEPVETPIKKYNLSGRPTKYKKEYAEQMLQYFDIEPTKTLYITIDGKNDYHKEEPKQFPADLPTLEGFACKIGVDVDTINNWATDEITLDDGKKKLKHPEFFGAYAMAKQFQQNILVTNGLNGTYNSNFAVFVATNFTKMRDKKSHEVAGPEGGPIPLTNKLTEDQEKTIRDKISEVMMEANK